jgi:hypothetical protein
VFLAARVAARAELGVARFLTFHGTGLECPRRRVNTGRAGYRVVFRTGILCAIKTRHGLHRRADDGAVRSVG